MCILSPASWPHSLSGAEAQVSECQWSDGKAQDEIESICCSTESPRPREEASVAMAPW